MRGAVRPGEGEDGGGQPWEEFFGVDAEEPERTPETLASTPRKAPHPFSRALNRPFDRRAALAKLWILWKPLGLPDDLRPLFTATFLEIEPEDASWREITDDQLCRLIDALEGFALVTYFTVEHG